MFLLKYHDNQNSIFAQKTLIKFSKIFSDMQNIDLSSIEESDIPPSSIMFKELSKQILDENLLNKIKTKGVAPKIKHPKEERNIKLMLDIIKKYKGYEQFISLHKICDKSLMIMLAIGTVETYKKGEIIYAKKDISNNFYYIIKGKVDIKAFDRDKVIEEYRNKIQDYKTKNNIKYYNNFISNYKNNVLSSEKEKHNNSINSYNSLSSFSINENNDSFTELHNKSKDLFHNKKLKLEKIKHTSIPKKSEVIGNHASQNLLNEIIKSKRRKPIFYVNNENDKVNILNNINNENNNSLYMKSFSKLQEILEEQKEQGLTIIKYEEGNFFGEWELMYKKLRENTAYAIEDTDLLVLDLENFKDYFKNEMLLADFQRKFFIKKIIPILTVNYLPVMIPIFYDKGEVVYTPYDKANYFYIIYKGLGALKQLKSATNKKDILLNLNNMETLLIIDKGCIVGLECCKNKEGSNVYYENTFIITEPNTIIYKINLDKFKINKEEIIKLKAWLKDLYQKQNKLIRYYKEKIYRPKNNREEILKNIENKNKKIVFHRDLKQNIKNNNQKNNDLPVKKKSISINFPFNKKNWSFNKDYFLSKIISNSKTNSNRSSYSSIKSDTNSLFSNSNSKSRDKSSSRTSNIYNTISPFLISEKSPKKKSFNPINRRYSNEMNLLLNRFDYDNKNMCSFNSNNNMSNEINIINNKLDKISNAKSRQKNNRGITYGSFKKQKYDDSFYKLIIKKHYRKITISSTKNNGKKKLNLFLYNSGNFDIPLLAFCSQKKKAKKK